MSTRSYCTVCCRFTARLPSPAIHSGARPSRWNYTITPRTYGTSGSLPRSDRSVGDQIPGDALRQRNMQYGSVYREPNDQRSVADGNPNDLSKSERQEQRHASYLHQDDESRNQSPDVSLPKKGIRKTLYGGGMIRKYFVSTDDDHYMTSVLMSEAARIALRKTNSQRGPKYTPRGPPRLLAAITRARKSLKWQNRVLNHESFMHDINLRLSSMWPYATVPMHWKIPYRSLYEARYHGHQFEMENKITCDDQTTEHIEKLRKDGKDSFQAAWDRLSASRKRHQWVPMALWLLHNSPKHVPDFLLATHRRPYPPFVMIADCMLYLRWFHPEIISGENFRSALSTCMDPEWWPTVGLSQRGVRLFAMFADSEDVTRAFLLMRRRDAHMSAETALAFMNRFTQGQDTSRAIEALRIIPTLHNSDLSLDSENVERHCCKLLTLDTVEEKDGVRNFKILPQLLELGVRPTRDMMNVVLANAFQTGDPHLGLDMFKYMKAQGMELDSYTYLTLLNDAVVRGDRGRVDMLLREIYPNEELKKNRYIASKIFHAHFIFAAKNVSSQADPSDMFLSMLDLYSRFYDPTPLKDLELIPSSYVKICLSHDDQPSSHVLFVMLATYLRSVKNVDRVMRLYRRFRELAFRGDKHIAPLLQYPHIFNEFLLALRSDSYAIRLCVQMVEDMLRPVTQPLIVDGREIVPAKPNVWTWNTLLSVFAWHRQQNAAQLIKEMMDKHGVGYNSVTWNTIISGHVHQQKVAETAAAIRDMESQGFSLDSYTLRALRFLRDPEQLRVAISELDKETQELADMEMAAEQKEHEELLDRGLRRLAKSVQKDGVPQ